MSQTDNPHTVHLWLTVTKPGAYYPSGASELYTRSIVTGHTPGEGDVIMLWPDVEWNIHRRWWEFDGNLHLSLSAMVVDPPEGQTFSLNNPHYSRAWRTEQDGDPVPQIEAAGWVRYRPGS